MVALADALVGCLPSLSAQLVQYAIDNKCIYFCSGQMTLAIGVETMESGDDYSQALGRSLVAARTANHMTQQELAKASGVSRATIAEIESGKGDPRLSNIVALAQALRTSPMMLLLEKGALTQEVAQQLQERTDSLNVPLESVEKMNGFLNSDSRSGPQHAAREGIRALGVGGGSGVGAAIGSVLIPGIGTIVGAALGGLLGEWSAKEAVARERGPAKQPQDKD